MTKMTNASSIRLDETDDQPSTLGAGAEFIADNTHTLDAWTQMLFSNLKRMAVDETFRKELISFRAPTLVPVDVEARQVH